MRILGIGDGFAAGACLVEEGRVRFAVSEERLSRIKNHSGYYHGFPVRSVELALAHAGGDPESIDEIAVSNFAFPPVMLRILALNRSRPLGEKELLDRNEFSRTLNTRLYSVFSERESGSAMGSASIALYGKVLARHLRKHFGLRSPIRFRDHHHCHAASAYYTQAEDDCLVATMDCHGDGLSGSLNVASKGELQRIASFPARDSLGSFYAAVTNHLGFHHHRHEGKVTGLAAYADPEVALADMRRMIRYDAASGRICSNLGRNQFTSIERFAGFLSSSYTREEIAAAAQHHLEETVLAMIRGALEKTGKRKVLLAGGVFGNVKLNQRVHELPEVDHLWVFPGMGDEGQPVGAALAASAERGEYVLRSIDDVFWGPEFGEPAVRAALERTDFAYERCDSIETRIADELARKKIVARCAGRLEFGPRALGNRSILFHAGDPSANDWLNKALRRSEFMPFAPATLRRSAADCFVATGPADHAATFMTVCFDCEPTFTEQCPAVVHVDGTARPQLVDERTQPAFFKILDAYEQRTGIASVINTSFNIHEEPVVCSPDDALRAFETAHLDYLALGDYLVWHRADEGR